MPEKEENTLVVFDLEPEWQMGPGGRPLKARGVGEKVVKATSVAVDEVQKNMIRFLTSIRDTLAKGAAIAGEYEVDTVEINAQISADGQIGFMGSNVGMAGSAGIKFVFKRRRTGEKSP